MFNQEQINVIVKCVEYGATCYADEIKRELVNTLQQYDAMYKRLDELGEFKKIEEQTKENDATEE